MKYPLNQGKSRVLNLRIRHKTLKLRARPDSMRASMHSQSTFLTFFLFEILALKQVQKVLGKLKRQQKPLERGIRQYRSSLQQFLMT